MACLLHQNIRYDMIKLVVFDLDGTIADTSEGILNSHRHAHRMMGRPVPSDEILMNVIGGPLLDTYENVFHFQKEEAVEAVRIYRAWYADYGIHQAVLYPGIVDLLRTLKENGVFTGIATLKAERFAQGMMEELGVGELFDCIYGMNDQDTVTKSDLIRKCISTVGVKTEETCMIGDSIHDLKGAQLCGTSFIGVSYGFGFRGEKETTFPICSSPSEIIARLNL